MTLLLDTHTFLWFCQDDPSLSSAAKALLEDPANRKLVSIASCWEIAIKASLGKLALGEPSATYISNALAVTGFELLPIALSHATAIETLPHHHRDPFDRMLAAQALTEVIPTSAWIRDKRRGPRRALPLTAARSPHAASSRS